MALGYNNLNITSITPTSNSLSVAFTESAVWVTQNPQFGTSDIQSVAYGNNLWVAVGAGGTLRTSTNSTSWITQTSQFGTSQINSVFYGNGVWVAVGSGGTLRTSTDVTTWTTRTSNFGTSAITSAAYANGLFVAVGAGATLRTSTDAVTWTTRVSNFGTSDIRSVAVYADNLWVAGGNGGALRTSTDATTWVTQTSTFSTNILSVTYGNGIWVAGGDLGTLRTSTDAITWVTRTSNFGTSAINSVGYATGLWYASGASGTLRTSTDAITWVTQTSNFGTTNINSAAYGNNVWIIGGVGGTLRTSANTAGTQYIDTADIQYSIDSGTTWVTQTVVDTVSPITISGLSSAQYGVGLRVVGADSLTGDASSYVNALVGPPISITSIVASTSTATIYFDDSSVLYTINNYQYTVDGGANWVTLSPVQRTSPITITGLTFGTSYYIGLRTLNDVGTGLDPTSYVFFTLALNTINVTSITPTSSTLTVSFAESTVWSTQTSNFGASDIYTIDYGNGLWVAAGISGTLRSSTDTVTWTTRTSNFGASQINSTVYGGGLFVAGGASGALRTSTDAVTWVTRTSNFGTTDIQIVAYGNSIFLAGGVSGTLRTSTDALTWTTRTSQFGTSLIIAAAYANSLWVAVGAGGTVRTSADAITWTTRTSNFPALNISGVDYGNGTWVISGDGGNIRTSTDAITWVTRTSNLGVSIYETLYGNGIWTAVAAGGALRTSTDAVTWVTQTSNFGATNILHIAYGNGIWAAVGAAGQIRTSIDTADIQYSLNSGASWVTQAVVDKLSPIVISGLTSGQYEVGLRVSTAGSLLGYSSNYILTSTEAPRNVVITTIVGTPNTATIYFVDPYSYYPITDYQYTIDGGVNWISSVQTTRPITLTGFTYGTSYYIGLRAVNLIGTGSTPTSYTFFTPKTVPTAPYITSVSSGNTQLVAYFTETTTELTKADYYQYSIDGGTTWTQFTSPSQVSISNLINGTSYPVNIRGVNDYGNGAASTTVYQTPTDRGATISTLNKALAVIHPEQNRYEFAPKLAGDIRVLLEDQINYLTLNTIDSDGVVWVVSDIEGWWNLSDPSMPNIERGFGDGSFDVTGRYLARDITLKGSILFTDTTRTGIAAASASARQQLLRAFDLVKRGTWLVIDEDDYKRAAFVRLSGRPDISTVNSKGRIDFSIGLRAADPIKYEWIDISPINFPAEEPVLGNGFNVGLIGKSDTLTSAADGAVKYPVYGLRVGDTEVLQKYGGYIQYEAFTNSFYFSHSGPEAFTASGSVGIVNNGDTNVYCYIRILGPLRGPATLKSNTTGQEITISAPTSTVTSSLDIYGGVSSSDGYILLDNTHFLDIDTRQREVHLGNFTDGESTTSARGLLNPLVDWIYLEPGFNTFTFTDFGSTSESIEAVVQMYWRSGWDS